MTAQRSSVQSLTAHGYPNRNAEKRFTVGGKLLSLRLPIVDDIRLPEAGQRASTAFQTGGMSAG
jgi:hypothetical protein